MDVQTQILGSLDQPAPTMGFGRAISSTFSPRQALRRWAPVVCVAALPWLSACGQKGPLYLPAPQPEPTNEPAAATVAPAASAPTSR